MTFLRGLVRVELAILVACFATVLGWKILQGVIRSLRHRETRGALRGGMRVALRLQMLAASLLVAIFYLVGLPRSAARGSLPPVSYYAVALLAGSQLVFLVAMAQRLLRPLSIMRDEEEK